MSDHSSVQQIAKSAAPSALEPGVFQVGAGVTRPMPLVPSPGASGVLDRGGALVGAVQITGTF